MTIKPEDLRNFYKTTAYRSALLEACSLNSLIVDEDFPDVLYNYDMRNLNCAGLDIDDLVHTLSHHKNELLRFVKLKLEHTEPDSLGEFPPVKSRTLKMNRNK